VAGVIEKGVEGVEKADFKHSASVDLNLRFFE
jgi:hypothetical protein